jgi:hypothetical protein
LGGFLGGVVFVKMEVCRRQSGFFKCLIDSKNACTHLFFDFSRVSHAILILNKQHEDRFPVDQRLLLHWLLAGGPTLSISAGS